VSRGLDRLALESLYQRIEKPMFNVMYRWTWDARDAQDLVQEAFVRLWAMRDRVDPATVEPLVYRIAMNLAWKQKRWKRLRTFLSLDDAPPDPRHGADDELNDAARRRRVRSAIEALPAAEREVVSLCAFSGMTQDDVARALDVPAGTIASRKNRAYAKLRDALGEEHGLA
jgi:RNA polymerase sigma-70 factor (ECF subfamily)